MSTQGNLSPFYFENQKINKNFKVFLDHLFKIIFIKNKIKFTLSHKILQKLLILVS